MNEFTSHSIHASFVSLYTESFALMARIKLNIFKLMNKPLKIIKLAFLIIIIVMLSYISISVLSGK